MDNLTEDQRRKNMRNIRSKNTVPERMVMAELKKRKIYFAKHDSNISGKPDIVFRRKKIVVFIDSDFWHGRPGRFKMPETNMMYWKNKIETNRERDRTISRSLRKEGWQVIRFWESDIKHDLEKVIDRLLEALEKRSGGLK